MDALVEILKQINDLSGAALDALQQAEGSTEGGGGGAPEGSPEGEGAPTPPEEPAP